MDVAKTRLSMKNRRVSFSDKASIRVFERDDGDKEFIKKSNEGAEAKSDSLAKRQKSPRKMGLVSDDKENVFLQPSTCNRKVGPARTNEVDKSAFYTTVDFIEKTQQNSELHIENTVDFTLLSVELSPKRFPLNVANKTTGPDQSERDDIMYRTFYVQETEINSTQSTENKENGHLFQGNKCSNNTPQTMMMNESITKSPSHRQTVVMDETLNDIQSLIIPDVELSSPLVPLEYVGNSNRKLNLRQLNDDLEHGKIQIYPGFVKTPQTAKRKCVQNLFDGSAMSFCSPQNNKTLGEKSLALTHNERIHSTHTKKDIRFSQADDNLLNNTSYLTQAILGDETIAGNVSKTIEENKKSNLMQKSILMEKDTQETSANAYLRLSNEVANGFVVDAQEKRSKEMGSEKFSKKSTDNYLNIDMDYECSFKQCEEKKYVKIEKRALSSSVSSTVLKGRNTLYFDEAIGVEIPEGKKECQMETTPASNPSYSPDKMQRRNTFHFNEGIRVETPEVKNEFNRKILTASNPSLSHDALKSSNTLHFNVGIENDAIKARDIGKEDDILIKENYFRTCSINVETKIDMSFDNNMSVSIDGDTSLTDEQPYGQGFEMQENINYISSTTKRTTTMHLNESIADEYDTQSYSKAVITKIKNHIDLTSDNELEDSQKVELETRDATPSNAQRNTVYFGNDDDMYMSPTVAAIPHRSLIEFEELESEVRLAQQRSEQKKRKSIRRTGDIMLNLSGVTPLDKPTNNSIMFLSPIVRDDTNKRLTVNLTPNLPMAKKRQTLIFNETITNCSFEETETLANHASSENIPLFNKRNLHRNDESCKVVNINNNTKPSSPTYANSEDIANQNPVIFQTSNVESVDLSIDRVTNGNSNVDEKKKMPFTKPVGTQSSMEISKLNYSLGLPNENVPNMKPPTAISMNSMMEITKLNNISDNDLEEEKILSPVSSKSKIPILIGSAKKKNSTISGSHQVSEKTDESNFMLNKTEKVLPYTDVIVDFQFKDSLSGAISYVDENPITISDVSAHFLGVRHCQSHPDQPTTAYEATNRQGNNGKMLYGDIERESSPLLSCEQNTIHNLTNFKNNYINLTYDKNMLVSDDIDKTCLSLVGTMLDDDVSDDEQRKQKNIDPNDQKSKVLVPVRLSNSLALKNKSLCLKCKRCQETIHNDTSIGVDSFALPQAVSPPDVGLSKLRRLRSRRTLADVDLDIDILSFNKTLDSTISSEISIYDHDEKNKKEEFEREDSVETIILNYKNAIKQFKLDLIDGQDKVKPTCVRQSFVKRLETFFCGLPGWIFDYQIQNRNILLFQFKRIKTFVISISYEEEDEMGYSINVKTIQCCRSSFAEKNWKAMDYLLDFQLKLDLPINLKTWCRNNTVEDVVNMFQRIDKICRDVNHVGLQLWRIVCREQASILREGKRIIIRKCLREIARTADGRYNTIERTAFRIEVMNIRKISYKDIVCPSLHLFHEQLQLLPQGLEFLQMFFKTPDQHLKDIIY